MPLVMLLNINPYTFSLCFLTIINHRCNLGKSMTIHAGNDGRNGYDLLCINEWRDVNYVNDGRENPPAQDGTLVMLHSLRNTV